MSSLVSAASVPEGCRVEFSGIGAAVIGWRWLREHDESEAGLDPHTGQRRLEARATQGEAIEVEHDAETMTVTWADGRRSEHRAVTLATAVSQRRRVPDLRSEVPWVDEAAVETWPEPPLEPPEPIPFAAVVESVHSQVDLLDRLHRSGWAQVDDVPKGRAALEGFVALIGYVRHTIFGGIWELAADLTDHADTAYSRTFLGPHTDGTYSHDGPGAQLFGCQERSGTGGESILVDGFAAATELARLDPEAARLLAALDVPCRYVEPGVSLRAERPVLRTDHGGRLVQVSINAYDREPFLLADPGEWDRFADAYDNLQELLDDESRWLRLGWEPGRLLVFDNWRVLHGRASFTGSRRFLGCYLNHEDLESAWRVHGLTA